LHRVTSRGQRAQEAMLAASYLSRGYPPLRK
jgi:hypothetical protein